MKNLITLIATILLLASLSIPAMAHDGDHGHKIIRSGKYGGVLTQVSSGSSQSEAEKSKAMYTAELVKDDEGTISIYLYDQNMKPIELNRFSSKASGTLESGKRKRAKTLFFLSKRGLSFSGKLPKKKRHPYNITIELTEGSKTLSMAFNNLD